MTISTHVISDPDELLEIRKVWNTFINRCSENPIFLSGFVKQFMTFYRSKGWTPLVLVISNDKMIVGIAPLMTKKKFGVRFVKFLSESWFSPDFIIDDQYRENCIERTLDLLFETLRCQFAELTFPAESQNLRILKEKCKANRIYFSVKRGRWADMGHCIIPVKCAWDEFEKLRGSNFRRRFRRLKRNLDQAGSWRIICIESRNKESDAFQKILDVERRSWKAALRTRKGVEIDQDLLMIWKGSLHTARVEPEFKWSVWFLELDNQTLAYTLVLQYKKTAFIIKTSYDERYKRFYPGIYVNNTAIRELFNKGQVKNIDWLTDLPFHRNWTSVCIPRVRVIMSQKSILSTILGSVLATEYARSILARATL